ncbi:MAG: hypothetical protein WAM04_10495 [Candidatus Sulfotelmatobacter sp.]
MSYKAGSSFDSIESAHEFVALLAETVREAKQEVEADVQRESSSDSPRRLDALRAALYSMEKLELHMSKSRRILNDLRSLRRLLFDERAASAKSIPDTKTKNRQARILSPTDRAQEKIRLSQVPNV